MPPSKKDSKLPTKSTENMTVKVNLDLPAWVVREIDQEAERIGGVRKVIMQMWISAKADELKKRV